MEQYLFVHGIIDDLEKLHISVLYLDVEHWKSWQWCKNSLRGYVS